MNSHSGLHPASAATGSGSNPSRYNADYPLASPGYGDPSQSYPQHQQQQQQQQQQPYLSSGHSPQPYHDDSRPSMRRASRSAPAPPYPVTDADTLLQPPNSHLGAGGVPSAAATAGGRPRAWSGNSQRSHHSTHSNHSHRSNRSTRSARSHDEHYRRHEPHHSDGSGHHHHHHHHETSSAGGHHHHNSHQHGSSYADDDGRRPEHRKRHHSDAALQRRDTHRPTLGDTVFSVWDTVKSALGPRDKY